MSEDKLTSFLRTGSDWARMKTTVPGIFILKLPAYKGSPTRLAVELNPADESGSPTKKRGLVIRSSQEFEEFNKLFQHDRLSSLLKSIDKTNPSPKKAVKAGEEILEI
ncbi:MAG: hypothetical protein L6N95_03340 [Candidatus Methylarchaceae archaeon HK01B]|nr:hypothetical protein [Candidatus Methylarchaceae archaeon HK01M]MCP8318844.1 hypothetical protein [Candidatus Methylarchaceae archaeon HK01B]